MEIVAFIIALIILLYGAFSSLLTKTVITAPMVFVTVGWLASDLELMHDGEHWRKAIKHLAEITLVIMLFADASRIDLRIVMRQFDLPVRLLGISLPLTILLGAFVAKLILPELTIWEAGLLGAILAPTDAALGRAVVSSESVPMRIRQTLNIESGLNDGIVVPFVMLFAALAAATSNANVHTRSPKPRSISISTRW